MGSVVGSVVGSVAGSVEGSVEGVVAGSVVGSFVVGVVVGSVLVPQANRVRIKHNASIKDRVFLIRDTSGKLQIYLGAL